MTKSDYAGALKRALAKPLSGSFWQPKAEGDWIAGKVLSFRSIKSKWAKEGRPGMAIESDEGVRMVGMNAMLSRLVEEEGVKKGDRILIAYRGRVKLSGNRTLHTFAIERVK